MTEENDGGADEAADDGASPDVVVIPSDENGAAEEAAAAEDEEESEKDGSALIGIESVVGTQSVLSGKIPLYVKIDPSVDSSRAKITWDVPRGLDMSDAEFEWFEMADGASQTFQIDVEPLLAGRYEIVVDVTAWRYDTNYVTSAVLSFEIDEDLLITPQTSEYKRNRMIYTVLILLFVVLLMIVAVFGVKFGIRWFKEWMSKD